MLTPQEAQQIIVFMNRTKKVTVEEAETFVKLRNRLQQEAEAFLQSQAETFKEQVKNEYVQQQATTSVAEVTSKKPLAKS